MKSLSLFAAIVAVHIIIIAMLLVQPGCQTQPVETPDPAQTRMQEPLESLPARQGQPPAQQRELDPAFNAGMTAPSQASTASSSGNRALRAPTRPPAGQQRTQPDMSNLEPVLQPLREQLPLTESTRDYTVRQGDTATAIARREGVALDDLLRANGLNRNSNIFIGQKLVIPAGASAQASTPATTSRSASGSDRTVTVASGDTLSGIARRNGTTVAAIRQLNNLTSDRIVVGQQLQIPAGSRTADSAAAGSSAQRSASQASTDGTTYTVKSGDTPGAIARQFGISARDLMSANGITDPRRMVVGQKLQIPGGNGQAATAPSRPAQSQPAATQPAQRQGAAASATPQRPAQPEASQPRSTPGSRDTGATTTPSQDMSALEALEEEDLPFVEVENIGGGE